MIREASQCCENRFTIVRAVLAATIASGAVSALAGGFGPAPPGDAKAVARDAIDYAPHPCPTIVSARRLADQSIKVLCDNGEDYRIISGNGRGLAMRCKVLRAMNIDGC